MKTNIVIAKYKENISWSDEFKDFRVVYEKSENQEIEGSKKLENKGRETDTYLNYILDNYENLPECVIFTQGDPIGDGPHTLHPVNGGLGGIFPNLPSGFNIVDAFREVAGNIDIVKREGFIPLTYMHNALFWDDITRTEFPEEAKGFDKFNGYGIMNDCFLRHPFDGIYALLDTRVLYSYLFDNKIDQYTFNDGAIFAVHKERILFHPKEFYEKALFMCNNPEKFGLSNNETYNLDFSKIRKTAYGGYQQDNSHSMRVINNMPCCFERIWSIIFNGVTK